MAPKWRADVLHSAANEPRLDAPARLPQDSTPVLGIIATAAVLALPPMVEIDTSGIDAALGATDAGRFQGELVLRLVEEGFAVGDDADARLSFRMEDDHVVVVATSESGDASVSVQRSGGAPVLALELVHQSAALLRSLHLAPSNADAHERATVLETTSGDPAVSSELARLLVDRGYVLVGDAGAARWRICVDERDEGFAVAVVDAEESCEPAKGDARVVENAAQGVEAALLSATWPEEAAPDEADPVSDPAPTLRPPKTRDRSPPPVAPPASVPPWRFGLGVLGGVQGRLRAAEGVVGLVVDALHPVGAGVLARVALVPSRGADVRVLDTFVAVGPTFRSRVRGRISFGIAVAAGLHVHRFRFGAELGRSVDANIEVPLGLGVQLVGGLDLTVDALAGFVTTPIEHTTRGHPVWSRDRFRFGGAVGLRYTWGRGRRSAR